MNMREKLAQAIARLFDDASRLSIMCTTMGFGFGWASARAVSGEWEKAIRVAVAQIVLSWMFDSIIRTSRIGK